MRIAVVGTGVSGSLAARLLATQHEVTVFEANDYAGGHAHTVDVEIEGRCFPVDTGFMVFNRRTYPNFCRLLEILEITSQPSDMSFSVSCASSNLEYQGSSLDGLFAQRLNMLRPSFFRMLRDIVRFNTCGIQAASSSELRDGRTVRQFLRECGVGQRFIEHYLVPMATAIWSSDPRSILDFPADFMVGFFANHGLLSIRNRPQWRTIIGGSRRYVRALLDPVRNRLRLNCPVESVTRHADRVIVTPIQRQPECFDEVVLATHADQSLKMLSDPTPSERIVLSGFPYQSNQAVLHTDTRLLPQRRRAWASWNYRIPSGENRSASVTYDLSRLQRHPSKTPILLTLNSISSIGSGHIRRTFKYHHPAYSRRSILAQRRFDEVSGRNRTHYCGAYWGYGFHEDGVNSALAVAKHFGIGLESCTASLYEGTVTHRRREPVSHQFRYRLFMAYLDLDELPSLVGDRRMIGHGKYAPYSFQRSDHLFEPNQPLTCEVRQFVRQQTGHPVSGPIRLLTQLRYFGYYMSPLNLFYLFDETGESVDAIVAEVNNTPWNERHCYVLWRGNRSSTPVQTSADWRHPPTPAPRREGSILEDEMGFSHPKDFHVSPFMDMQMSYRWRLNKPAENLHVHLTNIRDSRPIFDARLSLQRRALSRSTLRRMTFRYPLITAKITSAIYLQALKLWWKQCRFYKHPGHLNGPTTRRQICQQNTPSTKAPEATACFVRPSSVD